MAASVESSKQIEFASSKSDGQALPVDEEDDFRRTEESSEDATDNEKSAVSSADESGTKSEVDEDIEHKKENAIKVVASKEKSRGNGDFIIPLDTNAAEVVKSDGLRRERKQVERFSHIPVKHEEKPIIISSGSGVKLGEIEYIAHQINKRKPADLANLHRLFYDRRGVTAQIKRNIRLFSGFPFDDKTAEFVKKKKQIEKWSSKVVREICDVLGTAKKISKDQSIEGILEFCLQPADKGKKIVSKTKKTKSNPKSKKSPSKSKKSTDTSKSESGSGKKEKGTKRKLPSSGSGSDQDEVGGISNIKKSKIKEPPSKKSREGPSRKATEGKIYAEDDEEIEKLVSDSESDFKSDEEKRPKKKVKKPLKPKPSSKKSSPKKTSKASKPPDSDSGSDETKNYKKSPPKIPTDDDLKTSVKRIIENSDLKKVSMRMVVEQVFGEYPGVDLQDKKVLIKALVQEMLSS